MIRLVALGAIGAAAIVAVAAPDVAAVAGGGVVAAAPTAPSGAAATLTLIDQRFGVEPGEPWQATFRVGGTLPDIAPVPATNGDTVPTTAATSPPVPEAELRVVAHRVVEDRAELAELAEADDDGGGGRVVARITRPLAPALRRSGDETILELDVPTTIDPLVTDALSLRRPGLYPVAVQILVDGEVVTEHRTFLERLPVDEGTVSHLNIAVLAAADDPGPAPRGQQLADGREQMAAIADLATAVDGPLTVALPPVLLGDIETGDPDLADDLRQALAGDEVLALPAEQLDPSSAVAIDEADTFARNLRDGEEIVAAVLPNVPTSRSAWLATSPISTAAAVMLRNLGFDLVVMDAAGYRRLDGNIGGYFDTTLLTEISLGADDRVPGVVITELGALLDPDRAEPGAPADAAVRLLAELVTTRRELGGTQRRAVVLATPEVAVPDAAVVSALAALVADRDDLGLVPLSAVPGSTDTMTVDGQPQTVTLPTTAGPDLAERAGRIALTRLSTESAGSMQRDDEQLASWRAELGVLLSTGLSDEAVSAALARISGEAEAVRASVDVPRPFDFTLTGRSSTLRLNLRNNSTQELRVVIKASSPKLTFPDDDQLVELAPSGVTEVEIPVEARSNGTSSIQIEVVTPEVGQRIGAPVVLTAHVNALTGLGQVITGGALVVLGSWWFGHFRRRRRQRLAARAAAAAPPALAVVSPDAAEASSDETAELPTRWAELDESPAVR